MLGALPNMDPLVLCDQDKDGTSYGTWHSMAGWDGSCILLHEFQLTTTFTPKIGQLFVGFRCKRLWLEHPKKKCQAEKFCGSSFPSAHPPGTMSSSSACFLALKKSQLDSMSMSKIACVFRSVKKFRATHFGTTKQSAVVFWKLRKGFLKEPRSGLQPANQRNRNRAADVPVNPGDWAVCPSANGHPVRTSWSSPGWRGETSLPQYVSYIRGIPPT